MKMAVSKRRDNKCLARTWRNWNPCTLLVEMENGEPAMENSMKSPQKLKTEQQHDPAFPVLDIYATEFKSGPQRDISTSMFIAVLFTILRM